MMNSRSFQGFGLVSSFPITKVRLSEPCVLNCRSDGARVTITVPIRERLKKLGNHS